LPKKLAESAAAVAVNYSADKQGAERTVREIAREGGSAVAILADVSKPADMKRLFRETKKALGSVDVLINNAAVFQFEPNGFAKDPG
jgi:3-oxoacyl-[acyl-carrier protein] reductase